METQTSESKTISETAEVAQYPIMTLKRRQHSMVQVTVDPTEPKRRSPRKWWNDQDSGEKIIVVLLGIFVVVALMSMIGFAHAMGDDPGVSKEKVTQEVGNKIGFGFDSEGNLVIVEGGKLDKAFDDKFAELLRNECILDVQARNQAAGTSVDPNKICNK